jgi:glycine/D-amino acid oxidase-like deaminating enzyme
MIATEPHQIDWLHSLETDTTVFYDAETLPVKSPLFRAGLLETADVALVNPAKLAFGLRAACLRLGVRIFENSPVTRIVDGGSTVRAVTPSGTILTRNIALATNGFPSLLTRNRLFTVPIYDYVLMTEPLTDAQLADIGWIDRFGMNDSSRQFHYYRKTADNRILWGGYDAVYHRGGKIRSEYDQNPETFRRLADHFLRTFPQLGDIRFTHQWGGMIDMSTRLVAFQGAAFGGKVAYASGFTGLGVAATRYAASVMLDLLGGRDTERTRVSMVTSKGLPIPPEPIAYPAVQVIRRSIAKSDSNGGKDDLILRTANAMGFSFDS